MNKFLVVVDQTPECKKALRFAARRAANVGRGVVLLYVIEPEEFQHWKIVEDAMRAEAFEAAEARLRGLSEEVKAMTGLTPEYEIREGPKRDMVLAALRERDDIGALVLGAGVESEGPGPLVASLAGQMSGELPTPITIVPGSLSFEQIDAVSARPQIPDASA